MGSRQSSKYQARLLWEHFWRSTQKLVLMNTATFSRRKESLETSRNQEKSKGIKKAHANRNDNIRMQLFLKLHVIGGFCDTNSITLNRNVQVKYRPHRLGNLR